MKTQKNNKKVSTRAPKNLLTRTTRPYSKGSIRSLSPFNSHPVSIDSRQTTREDYRTALFGHESASTVSQKQSSKAARILYGNQTIQRFNPIAVATQNSFNQLLDQDLDVQDGVGPDLIQTSKPISKAQQRLLKKKTKKSVKQQNSLDLNSVKIGVGCQKLLNILGKSSSISKRFKTWKLVYYKAKYGVEFITNQNVQLFEYNLSQSLSVDDDLMTKVRQLMAAVMRYKSRRMARLFWTWASKCTKNLGKKVLSKTKSKKILQTQDPEVQFLLKKYQFLESQQEDNENLSDQSSEVPLPQGQKLQMEKPVRTAGPATNKEQFQIRKSELESLQLDSGQKQNLLFQQVLQSKNKEFAKILETSESLSQIGSPTVDEQSIQSKILATQKVKECLQNKMRHVLRKWHQESQSQVLQIAFKASNQKLIMQRRKVMSLVRIAEWNAKLVQRNICFAFNHWKFETHLEQKALDQRQKLFLINNAKLEVQKSRAALSTLYRQKQNEGQPLVGPQQNVVIDQQPQVDEKKLKHQVKQMCFDMLLSILKEADASGDSQILASQLSLKKSIQNLLDIGSVTHINN